MQSRNIERPELQTALASATPPILLEALGEAYYQKAHLPGAIALPLDRLEAIARERLSDKTAALVVYCASSTCRNSDVAAKVLRDRGYQNVRVYVGGKADWMENGLPVEKGAEQRAQAGSKVA